MKKFQLNWAARFKNKTWLTTFVSVCIPFVYQLMGMFDVVAPISENEAVQMAGLILNFLAGVGVIIDPTTAGVRDTNLAMSYTEPRKDSE